MAAPQPPPLPLLKIEAASEGGVECGLPEGAGCSALCSLSISWGPGSHCAVGEGIGEDHGETPPPATPGAELVCKPVSIFPTRWSSYSDGCAPSS